MSAMSRALIFALTLTAFTAKGDGELIAVADPISVDLRTESVLGVVGAAKLRYSPSWSSENGSVRIETVLGSTTNVIMTGGLKEEGEFIWAQPDADIPAYKLLLWTLSDGVAIGEPLTAIVSFGFKSDETATTEVDSREDSLRLVAEAGDKVNLAYSTGWAEDSSSVTISAIRLSGRNGDETGTNTIFSAEGEGFGATEMTGIVPGYWKLLYRALDSGGNVLLEYVTCEFKRKAAFVLTVR